MSTEKLTEPNTNKHIRKRKKNLYKQLRIQLEFYFSNANLQKDRFLSKQIKEADERYIDLDLFLKFNKIRSLTDNTHDLSSAIKKSSILQLDEEKKKIRRITPFIESTNVDERTVYIEPLSAGTTIESIQTHFSNCGKVVYVSLPRYKSTRDIKGFAFVEFESIEAAQLACKVLNISSNEKAGIFPKGSKKCKELEKQLQKSKDSFIGASLHKPYVNIGDNKFPALESEIVCGNEIINFTSKSEKDNQVVNIQLEDIDSTKVAEINNEDEKGNITATPSSFNSILCTNKVKSKSRKRKLSCEMVKHINTISDVFINNQEIVKDLQKSDENMAIDDVKPKKKKLKKKKKAVTVDSIKKEEDLVNIALKKPSKTKSKNKNKTIQDLKVIPKCEWMKLRSEYILNQKNNMMLLKEKLKQLKQIDEQYTVSQIDAPYGDEVAFKIESQFTSSNENKNSKNTELHFIPGVVIKFESKQEHSRKDIKRMLDTKYQIAYVDFMDGDAFGFVRCSDAETAIDLSNDIQYAGFNFHLLDGDDELKYWDKISLDRESKLATKIKKIKKGKDKLKNKADKYLQSLTNKQHILFD